MKTPQDSNTQRAAGSSPSSCSALELIDQLNRHIAQMAPHQIERHAGRLMVEARTKLRELWQIIEDDCESDTDARTEAAKHLGEWVWGDSYGIPSMQEVIERMASPPNIQFRDAGGHSPTLRTDDQPHSL